MNVPTEPPRRDAEVIKLDGAEPVADEEADEFAAAKSRHPAISSLQPLN